MIDWFHITMRITVLQQQTKSLQSETVTEMSKKIDSMKHLIWHGNVTEALEHLEGMLLDMDFIREHSPAVENDTGQS